MSACGASESSDQLPKTTVPAPAHTHEVHIDFALRIAAFGPAWTQPFTEEMIGIGNQWDTAFGAYLSRFALPSNG